MEKNKTLSFSYSGLIINPIYTPWKEKTFWTGLECGIIGSKYEGMEMISLGPTVKYPHSPKEKLFIPSIEKLWKFFDSLFQNL